MVHAWTIAVTLCYLLPSCSTLSPLVRCRVGKDVYIEGEVISQDRDNCYGSTCIDGVEQFWTDPCLSKWPECDGVRQHVDGQCCPVCLRTTSPLTNIQASPFSPNQNQCEYSGKVYQSGAIIEESPNKCSGTACKGGVVMYWEDECLTSTPSCEGRKVQVPGQCCTQCVNPAPTETSTTPPAGCHVNGKHYNVGDDVADDDPCSFCHCTGDSGVQCAMIFCDVPCPNPIYTEGECCPSCTDGCEEGGIHYEYDEEIPSSDPCEFCYCVRDIGIECYYQDCTYPNCDDPVSIPGQCCQVCPDPCVANSVTYEVGDIYMDNDRCADCTCTELGPKCGPLKCPAVNCIDPVHKQGECCPVCPNGPNCAYGRRLISVGDDFSPRPGITCSCSTDPWEPLACCRKMFGDRKAARILKRKSDIINPLLLQLLKTN